MMLTLCTVNVNGVRAAWRKGMGPWLADSGADVVTIQEVRAPDAIVHEILDDTGYTVHHTESIEKGRSGVAVLTKLPTLAVRIGNGADEFDDSGRWLEADLQLANGKVLTVISAYVHSGEVGTGRQDAKYRFLEASTARLAELAADNAHFVLTGDINIAHTERDIRNWKGNLKKAGFLPEERAYLDTWINEVGLVDVHRALSGDVDGPYTWWSMRGKAFDTDTGWRIDYHFASPDVAHVAQNPRVERAASWAERWTDHAPLLIDYAV
jgi:exodeoxyribonuclease III